MEVCLPPIRCELVLVTCFLKTGYGRSDSKWLRRLVNKRHCSFLLALSHRFHLKWGKLAHNEDSLAALWKTHGEAKVSQSGLGLYDSRDYMGRGILQARVLEWVAFPFSRGSSQSRDRTQVSRIAGRFFASWATRKDTWWRHFLPTAVWLSHVEVDPPHPAESSYTVAMAKSLSATSCETLS